MSTGIRRADARDAAAISALHKVSFADGWDAESVARLLSGPGGFAMIASVGGQDAGFVLLQHVPPEAELLSVGVLPILRRCGIGRALLRQAARELIHAGGEVMFLDVAADNMPALGLYRALGFGDISRRTRYYRGTTDAIVMQAALSRLMGQA